MTKKEIRAIDNLIQYLCEDQYRIKQIRQTLNINPDFDFLREVETIESLYRGVLEERKKCKSTFFFAGSSGWTIQYLRDKKTYKKGEKFHLNIFFSFVDIDNFE